MGNRLKNRNRMDKRASSVLLAIFSRVVLCVYALLIVYPILWTIIMSLKPNSQIFKNLWGLPTELAFDNFARAWTASGIGRNFMNTVFITVVSNVLILLVCIPLSYALGRFAFRGRGTIKAIIISGMLFPGMTALLTQYIGLLRLGLVNTFTGVFILYLAVSIPFSVFMLTNFFAAIPTEFEESAQLDGCGHWRTLWLIGVPLARNGIVMLTVLQVLSCWNEYQIALTLLPSPSKRTIAVGLSQMLKDVTQQTDWAAMFAAMVIMMSLSFTIYAVFQRKITENVTMGGIK